MSRDVVFYMALTVFSFALVIISGILGLSHPVVWAIVFGFVIASGMIFDI